jgi:hypothetical protein
MDDNKPNKRLTSDKNYKRPEKTYQDTLSNQEIKEKLKEYKKCTDIRAVSIGTHIRYFSTDSSTKQKVFRLGGTLNKIDPEGRFVVLGNGKLSWSVQIIGTQFWQKLSELEFKEELKKEIKKEMAATEDFSSIDPMIEKENKELKKEIKNLIKKLENLEEENKNLAKKNEQLGSQLSKIASEIKKEKKGK